MPHNELPPQTQEETRDVTDGGWGLIASCVWERREQKVIEEGENEESCRKRRWWIGWGRGQGGKHEQQGDRDVRQQMRPIKHMGSFLRGVMDPCFPDRTTQVCLQWLLMLPVSVFPLQFTSRTMFSPKFLSHFQHFLKYLYTPWLCLFCYLQTGRRGACLRDETHLWIISASRGCSYSCKVERAPDRAADPQRPS